MTDMTIETEQGQKKLATIDNAVSTLLRLEIYKNEEEAAQEIRQYRERDKKQIVDLSLNDVWAAFWITTEFVSVNLKNKAKFEQEFKKPFSREAIWEAFGGKDIDPTKANLPAKK